jgi:hypothetical protein
VLVRLLELVAQIRKIRMMAIGHLGNFRLMRGAGVGEGSISRVSCSC